LTLLAGRVCQADNFKLSTAEQDWLKGHPVIRMGIDAGFGPYTFLDAEGHLQGIAAEFIAEIERHLGIRFEIVSNLSWTQLMEEVRERRLDALATVTKLPERDIFLKFTEIYLPTPLVIMTRRDTPQLRSLKELQKLQLVLVEGYSSSRQLVALFPGLRPRYVTTPLEGLRSVATGQTDAYAGVLGVNSFLAARNGITNLKVNAACVVENTGQRFGVRKDWPQLAQLLDKSLLAIPEERRNSIFQRWLPRNAGEIKRLSLPSAMMRLFPWLLGGLVLSLLGYFVILIFNRKLKKAMEARSQELSADIIKRMQTEEALEKSKDKFRNIADLLPEVIFECDQQGKFTYVNSSAFEKFGYSEEDYSRGITALQVIAPDDRERAGENIKRIMSGEKFGGNEYKALRKDGSEFFALIYSSPIMSNNIPTGLRGIIIDMTARKKIEEELRQKHEQLKLALQGGNLGAWVWDIPTGHEVYNEILPKLLEYKLDEIIPNIKWWEDKIHPNDLEQVNIDLQDHFDGKTDFFINEHRLKTKNGDWRWFLDHGQVMERDNDGKPIRMIGTLRDITKRKQAVEELEDLKNNLEKQVAKKTEEMRGQIEKSERSRKAMLYMVEDLNRTSRELQSTQDQLVRSERLAAIGELAGGVAHELRNSLGVLTNAVSYLKLVVPMDNQTVKKNFDHMTDNVARANKVISNLLDLTRDIKAAKSVFPISTLIDAVLKDINISGRIKVEKRWPEEETYPVFADRDHLYHIIFNLLKNAGEAMTPPGGKPAEGKLMLRCRRDDNGKVIFSISDTGGGILPEDKEKIFDPLFTKKSSGIGLGLSISRRYAELNGGSLTVESEVGVGSTFILTLPGGK